MAPRKQKIEFGEASGSCSVCGITLWEDYDDKPAIWPCNIKGCPYEKPEDQNPKEGLEAFSIVGSGLGQID